MSGFLSYFEIGDGETNYLVDPKYSFENLQPYHTTCNGHGSTDQELLLQHKDQFFFSQNIKLYSSQLLRYVIWQDYIVYADIFFCR